jgi:hypothetical protein
MLCAFGPAKPKPEEARLAAEILSRLACRSPEITSHWSKWTGRMWPIAVAALPLLVAIGLEVHPRPVTPVEPEKPMIYRSLQFPAISPIGKVAHAPAGFSWAPVEGAASYQFRLMEVDRTEIWSAETNATTAVAPGRVQEKMTPGRGFLWIVVARNSAGETIAETDFQKLYISVVNRSAQAEDNQFRVAENRTTNASVPADALGEPSLPVEAP